MKPFLLIAGEDYYPQWKAKDWIQTYETIEEAQKWETVKATIGFDKNGQPIIINSWDDKVKRSINNEKENY